MWKLFRMLFKKSEIKLDEKKRSQADEIRKYAKTTFITTARQKGEKRISFSASDVHKGMRLNNRMPLVCGSIDAKKFLEFARVELIRREGPKHGANAQWTFKV